jgi:hypothetical protein
MDLRGALQNLVEQAREIMGRLRTCEAEMLSRADLHILEVQLYLLEKEVTKRKDANPKPSTKSSPPFPPFVSEEDAKRENLH